eukprot:TRINITY_DN21801_c0_g1_i1.p1 TRINITY_DN21801_c0_g1~~TRINITY_DN21801_c0_g1_i1.p1  ORF type:complete len:209 (+),score=35.86 TRINITY_DN21801_c0_g1_i1:33-659(+)
MGLSRDSIYKRANTGGRQNTYRKKRKFRAGRQASNTKIGEKRVHTVYCRGGNIKQRALRLDTGNFSWGSEGICRKTRILQVVYSPTNIEYVRTNTLVKNSIVQIEASAFRNFYENFYDYQIKGKVSKKEEAKKEEEKKEELSEKEKKRRAQIRGTLDTALEEQLASGRILAAISSRPGQVGRADGYILEGKELEFYQRRLKAKKSAKN